MLVIYFNIHESKFITIQIKRDVCVSWKFLAYYIRRKTRELVIITNMLSDRQCLRHWAKHLILSPYDTLAGGCCLHFTKAKCEAQRG